MRKYVLLWNYIKEYGKENVTLTFAEIGNIAGAPVDHSFLQYKKELTEYGYRVKKISLKDEKVIFEKC